MLRWVWIFLVVSLIAAIVGFSGSGHESRQAAGILALAALILAIGSWLLHARSRRS